MTTEIIVLLLIAALSILFAPLVYLKYLLEAAKGFIDEYNNEIDSDSFSPLFLAAACVGGVGIFLWFVIVDGLSFLGMYDLTFSGYDFMVLGILLISTNYVSYLLTHRIIRSLISYFYPGTTFQGHHLAKITKLGRKREFHKFGTRWLTNMI